MEGHSSSSAKSCGGSQAPMAHSCNPSYSGGGDQENHTLKPARAKLFWEPLSQKKKKNHKKGLAEWLKV
jgi:hypothetical protein